MLELMNRRNRFGEDWTLFNRIAERGYALGTDFIVGHPGEDENIWQEALSRVEMLPLTHLHAFSYSRRDNTASAVMKNAVRGDIAKARHRELTAVVKEKNRVFRQAHSSGLEVLLESGKEGIFHGFDQYFNRVQVQSGEDLSGNWVYLESVEVRPDGNYAAL
jgi:tRNA A37 methylthiotransferase MiaB